MKKTLSIIALILVAVMAFALTGCQEKAPEKKTLVMGTNAAFPPYEFHDEVDGKDTIVGIDAEIAQAICDKLGYTLQIDDMDFNSIVPAVVSGKIDLGMAGMTVTPTRLEDVNFSNSYATGIQVVIVKEDSAIAAIDDLGQGGLNIGVQTATTGDIYSTTDYEETGLATIQRFPTGADAIAALLSDKVDCVIIDNEPAKAFVEANEGLKILDTEYAVEDYAIAINKEKTDLLKSVNDALDALIKDGTVQKIVDKYISAN